MRSRILLGCLWGLLAVSFVYAQSAAGEAQATQAAGGAAKEITCPSCKTVTQATKKGGGVHLETKMVCPECKGKGTALEPHACGKCGQELLLCDQCKKVVAHVTEKPTTQVKCPTCKEVVTATKKGGGVHLEKEMVCPSCKEEIEGLGVFKCERCGEDILACPICRQYSGTVVREEAVVELKCPNCKEMVTATKKGGGVSLEKKMSCPHCKKEVGDLEAHTCSKCGTDMFICPLCKNPM